MKIAKKDNKSQFAKASPPGRLEGLFFLIGFMACGKTSIGKLVAERTGYDFVDLDQWIESENGRSVQQIFAEQGEDAFRKLEHEYLQKACFLQHTIVATGGGVPCFYNNMELMNSAGKTVYLKFPPEELKIRIQQSSQDSRPLVAGKSDDQLLQFVRETLAEREQYYRQADFIVSGNDAEIAEQIIDLVERK